MAGQQAAKGSRSKNTGVKKAGSNKGVGKSKGKKAPETSKKQPLSNSHIAKRNPYIKHMDQEDVLKRNLKYVTKGARVYQEHYCSKDITYVYENEFGRELGLTIRYEAGNFMHMCGVKDYKGRSAEQFYNDALVGKILMSEVVLVTTEHFDTKIKALRKLKELTEVSNIGVVNNNVVYNQYDFGQMIRTKEDLISIGTVVDKKTKMKVPLTLINIPLSKGRLKAAMRGYCSVKKIIVKEADTENRKAI